MASINIYDLSNNVVDVMELNDSVFNSEVKESLIHQVVKIQLANRRAGTVAVKNRSAVSGGGKKPFKQKGTGNARQGCSRAPQYPGGGVAFGPQAKDYNLSINKKCRKAAVRSVLSLLYKENKITVVNNLELDAISTKCCSATLNNFDISKAVIVADKHYNNFELSARNIPNIKVTGTQNISLFHIVKYNRLILTKESVRILEGALQP